LELDLIDRKIIYELDLNARKSYAQVARKLKINRNVVVYRVNELKKRGIIKGAYLEINNQLLGYHNIRLFIKFSNATFAEIDNFAQSLAKDKRVMWLSSVLGKWDLDIVYMVRTISEFDDLFKKIMDENNSIIDRTHISILANVKNYPKDYLLKTRMLDRKPTTYIKIGSDELEVSELDRKICTTLSDNADMTLSLLAAKLGVSMITAKEHMRFLEKKRVISGYRLFLDTEKMGLRYYKVHISLKRYAPKDAKSIEQWIFMKDYAIYNNRYLNGEDLEVELHLEKEAQLIEFQKELLAKYGQFIKDLFVIEFYSTKVFRCIPGGEDISHSRPSKRMIYI
jgi:DNA-binding Lrp family transcriptional regulator